MKVEYKIVDFQGVVIQDTKEATRVDYAQIIAEAIGYWLSDNERALLCVTDTYMKPVRYLRLCVDGIDEGNYRLKTRTSVTYNAEYREDET